MTWFKVDDGLWGHPKWLATPASARGLWVTAGSWSACNLTDGVIPRHVLPTLGGKPKDAAALVEAGLWIERAGGGWLFHEWNQLGRQPTKEAVMAEREAAADRQKRAREKAAEKKSQEESRRDSRRDASVTHGVSHGPPDPTRPVPSSFLLTLIGRLAAGDARGGPPPAEVIAAWQEIAGPRVNIDFEARSYFARFGDRPAVDERAAWLGWLRKAKHVEKQLDAERSGTYTGCGMCLDGWLAEDDQGHPRPCRACRPHLRPVEAL